MKILIFDHSEALAKQSAALVQACVAQKPNAVLGFATGSTPVETYQQLIKLHQAGQLDFSKVTTFNLDEYYGLPADNDQSYSYFMRVNLFDHINIPAGSTNLLSGIAPDPKAECERYDQLIESHGGIDLQIVGIGKNGHIAFNEPSDEFLMHSHLVNLTENTIQANSRFFESPDQVPTQALTMGSGQIFKARQILMLATGEGKAQAIHDTLRGPVTPRCPSSILQLHPDTVILLDRAAASMLD